MSLVWNRSLFEIFVSTEYDMNISNMGTGPVRTDKCTHVPNPAAKS